MILLNLISFITPVLCLYVDERIGIEADVNGKRDDKYDDSLISNHNFRKKRGDVWRRNGIEDFAVFDTLKTQIADIRRSGNVQKTNEDQAQSKRKNDVIDVKFRKDKPSRRAYFDDTEFAYHDKMQDEGAGDIRDFERNLKVFESEQPRRKFDNAVNYLHGDEEKPPRRSVQDEKHSNNTNEEKEILFHHAIPVDVKIYGYLQMPLEE